MSYIPPPLQSYHGLRTIRLWLWSHPEPDGLSWATLSWTRLGVVVDSEARRPNQAMMQQKDREQDGVKVRVEERRHISL